MKKLYIIFYLIFSGQYIFSQSKIIPPDIHRLFFENNKKFTDGIPLKIPSNSNPKEFEELANDPNPNNSYGFITMPKVYISTNDNYSSKMLNFFAFNKYVNVEGVWYAGKARYFTFHTSALARYDRHMMGNIYCISGGFRKLSSIDYANKYDDAPGGRKRTFYAITFSYTIINQLPELPKISKIFKGKAKAVLDPDDGSWKIINFELDENTQNIYSIYLEAMYQPYIFPNVEPREDQHGQQQQQIVNQEQPIQETPAEPVPVVNPYFALYEREALTSVTKLNGSLDYLVIKDGENKSPISDIDLILTMKRLVYKTGRFKKYPHAQLKEWGEDSVKYTIECTITEASNLYNQSPPVYGVSTSGYTAKVSGVYILRDANGQTIDRFSYSKMTPLLKVYDSREKALNECIYYGYNGLRNFVYIHFPIQVHIAEVMESKNSYKIKLDAGSKSGVYDKQYFEIYIDDESGVKIGEAEVTDCEAEYAICKVKDGKEVVKSNLDGGVKIKLVSKTTR
jgi:hypothetical protein